jgi:hypothetical protein
MTAERMAGKVMSFPTKISRFEMGAHQANFRDVRDLCGLYSCHRPLLGEAALHRRVGKS